MPYKVKLPDEFGDALKRSPDDFILAFRRALDPLAAQGEKVCTKPPCPPYSSLEPRLFFKFSFRYGGHLYSGALLFLFDDGLETILTIKVDMHPPVPVDPAKAIGVSD